VSKLEEGFDVVYGTPRQEQHGLWRDMASRTVKIALQQALGVEAARHVSAFRVFRADLRRAFARFQSSFVSIDVLLSWGTSRFTGMEVEHDPRRIGSSQYTVRRLLVHALTMLTGFSTLPLRLASFLGFGCSIFGIVVLLYVVGRYVIQGVAVPGFPFLASIIAIFAGAQLFSLGIIGEYLARMHFRMLDRPAYTVKEAMEADEVHTV
jgi:undecaprenyl-phosphate 4-deoxy-4-formamido-L-arabinose transferase